MGVERETKAEAELRVVFEERVGPGGSPPIAVGRVRRGRKIAAVNRRATGRIGDEQPIAKELGEELEIGRLATARAGP